MDSQDEYENLEDPIQPSSEIGGVPHEELDHIAAEDDAVTMVLPVDESTRLKYEGTAKLPQTDYRRLLERSYMSVVDAIFQEEKATGTESADDHVRWRSILWKLFASIPRPIFKAALTGELPYLHLTARDPDITQYYDKKPGVEEQDQEPWILRAETKDAPGLYGRFLVDETGVSPTPNDFTVITTAARAYVSGKELAQALEIDCAFRQNITTMDDLEAGRHIHLGGDPKRVGQVYEWCRAVDLRCSTVPLDRWDAPYLKPLMHCGYARSIAKRLGQYRKHQSVTWLVLLIESICKVVLPGRGFSLHSYALAFLAEESEIELGERALTRCLNAYSSLGGFCVAAPGQCSSAEFRDMNYDEKELIWAELLSWREHDTDFEKNAKLEAQLLHPSRYKPHAEYVKECQVMKQNIARDMAEQDRLQEMTRASLGRIRDHLPAILRNATFDIEGLIDEIEASL